MANYYGTWQGVQDLFGGQVNSYFTMTIVKDRILPRIYHVINSEMAPYYDVPFDSVVKHPKGVPPILGLIAEDVCKAWIQMTTEADKKPRKVGSLDTLIQMIRAQLKRIKLDAGKDMQELVYSDGTVVARKVTTPSDPKLTPSEYLAQNWIIIDDDGYDSNTYYEAIE